MPNGDGPSPGEIAFYDTRDLEHRVKKIEDDMAAIRLIMEEIRNMLMRPTR